MGTEQPLLRPAISQPSSSTQAAVCGTAGSSSSTTTTAMLQGHYIDNLGSILLVKEHPTSSHNQKPTFEYVGHTDKHLQFQKPS
jgi:hypothetical protein